MSNPQLTYWEECITCAADNGNISLTYSEVTQLAEGVMGGHENYGMAFYSPPASDRMETIERERKERIEAERTPCASKTKEAIAEAIERIMAYVKWNPECRTTSVAKSVGCCKSVAFDRLCRLEDDGIITRYKDNNVSYWSVA